MKRLVPVPLCVSALLLCGAAQVEAVNLTWQFLMHASVAGKGPGPDGLIGTSDDTTWFGEKNGCNFSPEIGCEWMGTPAIGTYSYGAVEIASGVVSSCYGGDTPGQPCISGPCSPLGDYCPGDYATCIQCPHRLGAPDTFVYFGTEGIYPGEAEMRICQEYDGPEDPDPSDAGGQTEFQIWDFRARFSEPFLGPGGSSLMIFAYATTDFIGGPCGVGTPVSGSFDAYVGGFPGTFSMPFSGDVIDMDNPMAASCGYGLSEVDTLIANARSVDAGAEYLMILCGSVQVPSDSTVICMAGGVLDFVFVLYTADDATQCPDNDCPSYPFY